MAWRSSSVVAIELDKELSHIHFYNAWEFVLNNFAIFCYK